MNFPYQINDDTLTLYVEGEAHQVHRDNTHFQRVVDALNDDLTTAEDLLEILDQVNVINNELRGEAEIVNGVLVWNGYQIHDVLGERVIDIVRLGLDVQPWLRFVENVYANPEVTSRDELYLFLEKHDLPITEDGHFLAFKKVRADYRDCYSGTFDNSIGQVCEMPRDKVDPNRHITCSRGLHFCSRDYLKSFGGARIMILKINPADVVSIPSDYDNAKGRCWRYEVVGEIGADEVDDMGWDPVVYNPEDDLEDDDYDPWGDYEDDYDPWDDDEDLVGFAEDNQEQTARDSFFEWYNSQPEHFVNDPEPEPELPAFTPQQERTQERSRSLWERIRHPRG